MESVHQACDISYPEVARFWVWVEKGDTCWEWQGNVSGNGYGRITLDGERRYAHRVAWEMVNGAIPDGLVIDHICHNTLCVNPEHLRAATPKQNLEHILPVNAASGYRGVHRYGKKWRGCVMHHRAKHHTDSFLTPEEANEAVVALRNELFTHNALDRV